MSLAESKIKKDNTKLMTPRQIIEEEIDSITDEIYKKTDDHAFAMKINERIKRKLVDRILELLKRKIIFKIQNMVDL